MLDSRHIIRRLLATPAEREKAILLLARDQDLKQDTESYVKRNSGSEHDAKTIFHDAIIVFVKKVFTDKTITLDKSIEAYLFGIVKNLWSNELRKRSKKITAVLDDSQTTIASEENTLTKLMSEEKRELLKSVLTSIGDTCKQVLLLWAYGHSMKLIAQNLNYASEGMARKKKHQCLQKLKTIIASNASLKQQLQY